MKWKIIVEGEPEIFIGTPPFKVRAILKTEQFNWKTLKQTEKHLSMDKACKKNRREGGVSIIGARIGHTEG
jgi:hypothetical protein